MKKVEWECGGEHMALACKIKAEFKNLVSEREPGTRAKTWMTVSYQPLYPHSSLPALWAAPAEVDAESSTGTIDLLRLRPRASYVYTLWLTESGDISDPHGDGDVVPTMTNGTGFPNSTADTLGGAYTTACANATAVHNGALARARSRGRAVARSRGRVARRAPRRVALVGSSTSRAKPSRL